MQEAVLVLVLGLLITHAYLTLNCFVLHIGSKPHIYLLLHFVSISQWAIWLPY